MYEIILGLAIVITIALDLLFLIILFPGDLCISKEDVGVGILLIVMVLSHLVLIRSNL